MTSYALPARRAARASLGAAALRGCLLALLICAVLVPGVDGGGLSYPAVSHFSSLLPFCGLLLLPLLDMGSPGRAQIDLLALLAPVLALGLEQPGRHWPTLLIYPPLAYLLVRMTARALAPDAPPGRSLRRAALTSPWLASAIAVLALVHVSWALAAGANTDVAAAGSRGASAILHGRAIYGPEGSSSATDPHLDTYGPADYEAYVPARTVAGPRSAARLTTLLFDLLTAGLLFLLGRAAAGRTAGLLLAYCWLAFPFTLYEDALAFNDSIVAAALVATILLARRPAARGAAAAAAAWTKLSPLALVPLLLARGPDGPGRRRAIAGFAAAFAAASAVLFLPVLAHGDLALFAQRSFGFQAGREPSGSLWSVLGNVTGAPWAASASRIVHGLLVAGACAFALLLARLPIRPGADALCAASAAILIAVEICLGYYSFSYILWFAPLVLAAVILGLFGGPSEPSPADAR